MGVVQLVERCIWDAEDSQVRVLVPILNTDS